MGLICYSSPVNRDVLTGVFKQARQEAGNYPLYYSEFNDGLFYSPAYHDTPYPTYSAFLSLILLITYTYASSFLIKVLYDVQGLVDLLSWWTFSDIFEGIPNNGYSWGLIPL